MTIVSGVKTCLSLQKIGSIATKIYEVISYLAMSVFGSLQSFLQPSLENIYLKARNVYLEAKSVSLEKSGRELEVEKKQNTRLIQEISDLKDKLKKATLENSGARQTIEALTKSLESARLEIQLRDEIINLKVNEEKAEENDHRKQFGLFQQEFDNIMGKQTWVCG